MGVRGPGNGIYPHADRRCTPTTRLLYDRRTAAQQLSISVRSLDYIIQQQQIATRRLGKKVLIHRAELSRFARANHTAPIRRSR